MLKPQKSQKSRESLFANELAAAKANANMEKIMSLNAASGVTRIYSVIINQRQYKFTEKESNIEYTGVTFSTCDGIIKNQKGTDEQPGEKGVTITNYSVSGKQMYDKFNELPTPPYAAILEVKMTKKKTILENIYPYPIIAKLDKDYFDKLSETDNGGGDAND